MCFRLLKLSSHTLTHTQHESMQQKQYLAQIFMTFTEKISLTGFVAQKHM